MGTKFCNEARIKWDAHGAPYSVQFDDKYFCQDNGYEEAVHVCCQGNSLEERFLKLPPDTIGIFTIIETGFGTGLDFCCAWQLWDECAPVSWRLRFISLELYPLTPFQQSRALGLWPQLSRFSTELITHYMPAPVGGRQDLYLGGDRVHLTIIFDDVVVALQRIRDEGLAGSGADAWFLDGFAPSKNPQMWAPQVFELMTSLSHTGTTYSTFTVAGVVRRRLTSQGFSVKKVPGHGKKKQILTGYFQG